MFNGCENLKEINVSGFNLKGQCLINQIFDGINKKECKLIAHDETIKNIFNK
jgi:surface protein